MEFRRMGKDVFVRLDVGDELHSSIRELSEHGIFSAAITSGIGRVRDTKMGYLDSNGVYQTETIPEPMELLSTQGNLAPRQEGAFTHIHVVLCDDDHVVRGGHLFEATVEVTAEIHLRVLDSGGGSAFERVETDSDFVALSFCNIG